MITADWVAVGLAALFLLLGLIAGFGRGLKFFTSGIFGFIISIVICYFFGGLIYKFEFVQQLLEKMIAAMEGKNGFCDFLIDIRIDLVVYYIALFTIVSIIRIIIVLIIKNISEADNAVMKVLNKAFGVVLFAAALIVLTLIVFHIIALIGGNTADNFLNLLSGSAFKLDKLFENDVLENVINKLK